MASFETFKHVTPEEALAFAIEKIPYYEVTDNTSHLPNKNTFKIKLLGLLAQEGKLLPSTEFTADIFDSIYKNWHEAMIQDFNPENPTYRHDAERHQAHIDPHESEWRDIA